MIDGRRFVIFPADKVDCCPENRAEAPEVILDVGDVMNPKRILVHVQRTKDWSPHLDVAFQLGKRFGASVQGLIGFVEAAALRAYFSDGSDILAEERKHNLAIMEERRARFLAEGAKLGVKTAIEGIEWDVAGALSLAARFFDLVVVGQRQTHTEAEDQGFDIAGECLRASGRPVLMVPDQGEFSEIGRRILIAWNGSRESALALQAATPFLPEAEAIFLAEAAMPSKFEKVAALHCLDIRGLLLDHGFGQTLELMPEKIADTHAGDELIRLATERGCDLIVMGSYGRSWLRDWVLGSATSAVLGKSPIPVLTQH